MFFLTAFANRQLCSTVTSLTSSIFCSITPPPSLQLPHITSTYKSTSVSNASGHTCSPTLRSPSPERLFISATCCQVRNHTLRTKVLHLKRVRILLFSLFFLAHARKHARTRTLTNTPIPQLQQTNKQTNANTLLYTYA